MTLRLTLAALVLCGLYTISYAQSADSARAHYEVVGKGRMFHHMVSLEVVDDFVPFLKLGANDEGYTLGTLLNTRIPLPKKNCYFDVSLSSKLYTKMEIDGMYRRVDGLLVIPQYFTEVSFLSVSYNQYYPRNRIMLHSELGGGIYNQFKPIAPLALYLQGGADGKRGFHDLLGKQQSRQDNVPTGGIRPNFYSQFSIEKFYFFNKKQRSEAAYLSVEPGLRIVAPFIEGSLFFINLHGTIPIVRMKPTQKVKFRLAGVLHSHLLAHADGVVFLPEWGLEFDLFLVRLGYTNTLVLGPQQDSYVHYNDTDPLMRIYVQISF